jgi:hypothetical protein
MAEQIPQLAATNDALLTGAGVAETPTLNPAPIYSDPAEGPAPPIGAEARPPDPAHVFASTAPAPAAAQGGAPDPAAAYAASGPAMGTETTSQTTTSGMSDADAKAQRGANASAEAAQTQAASSATEQQRLAVKADEAEQTRLLHEAAQQQRKLAAKQSVVDMQEAEVKNKLQAGADWRPDRAELFAGSTGAARGILAAVAVMAGGWMQGRGMTRDNQFMSAIERMIDENVNDQVRHNSSTMQFLREQKGDIQSAAAELKARQMQYAVQKVNARAALSKIPAAQAGVQAFNDAATARTAEWHAEQEKALRKQVSSTISKHTAPVAPVKGAQLPRGLAVRHANNNQFVREWQNIKSQLQGAEQSGDLNGYLGTVATHGANWVQEHLNGLPPGQQKAAILMARLEQLNHLHTGSTMVGLSAEEKERFGKVGVPEKIRDVANTYTYFDELARDKIEENKSFAGGEADPTELEEGGPEGSY